MLVRDKHSGLLDPFVSCAKMRYCEYAPWTEFATLEAAACVLCTYAFIKQNSLT
jgi:hypothetical protein